ncbi:MAG: Do family serine endopeptidase [Candidatus Omnitrophica bacterium]|nr:Do family serine endopeptidase [Candidatus Omnitrophota bacterium]
MKKVIMGVIFFICFLPLLSSSQDYYRDLESLSIKVANEIGKSVVSIKATVKQKVIRRFYYNSPQGGIEEEFFRRFFEDFFGQIPQEFGRVSVGSGVIIDRDGYILTNVHVVSDADEVKVVLYDGRELKATVKGIDPRTDLAVIKINAKDITVAKLGDSDKLKIGQFVFALGNPFGISTNYANAQPTVTFGVISALHRFLPGAEGRDSLDDLIQTDAAINPGNSGGPLVNLDGEVVGINIAIITRSGGHEGIGFAIPINKAKLVLGKLVKGEKVLYGWLGVNIQDLNQDLRNYFGIKEQEGVIVVRVFKNSPAEKAGLKEGDLILSFDNKKVTDTRELIKLVSITEVNKIVPLKIIRDGKEQNLEIKIGARPDDLSSIETVERTFFRGMEVEDLTSFWKNKFNIKGEEGVVIVNIEQDSSAERAGLAVGDVITIIGNRRVRNKEDFERAISNLQGDCLVKTNRGFFVLKEE